MLKIVPLICLSIISSFSWADGIDPEKVIENTISLIVKDKPNEAFEFAIKSNKYFADMKSDTDTAKIEFVSFVKQVGVPTSCEKLVTRNLIQRYRKDVYLCLSPKQPFEIKFEFYKQQDAWRVQSFGFSSSADDYIDESIEIEIGKKSVVEQKN